MICPICRTPLVEDPETGEAIIDVPEWPRFQVIHFIRPFPAWLIGMAMGLGVTYLFLYAGGWFGFND